ncbi:unnamed protein product [Lupinus luteus]|uniref:Uncharacterized protein n=1 Tax=Lupinus luteus TaxID=3873 RepID=A0AAV1W5D2_LUPLU
MSQSHNPPIKKPKPKTLHGQAQDHKAQHAHEGQYRKEAQVNATLGLESSTLIESLHEMTQGNLGSQGLLEDMVAFMVKNP